MDNYLITDHWGHHVKNLVSDVVIYILVMKSESTVTTLKDLLNNKTRYLENENWSYLRSEFSFHFYNIRYFI
jgi:hypothetical protein